VLPQVRRALRLLLALRPARCRWLALVLLHRLLGLGPVLLRNR
jgi:hypothetical protein